MRLRGGLDGLPLFAHAASSPNRSHVDNPNPSLPRTTGFTAARQDKYPPFPTPLVPFPAIKYPRWVHRVAGDSARPWKITRRTVPTTRVTICAMYRHLDSVADSKCTNRMAGGNMGAKTMAEDNNSSRPKKILTAERLAESPKFTIGITKAPATRRLVVQNFKFQSSNYALHPCLLVVPHL